MSPGPGFFSTCPSDGARSQLAAPAWGTCRGGGDPPRPALWNTAVGRTQSFHPTWWSGEGGGQLRGALALPGAPSRLQMPRLSHFPPTPEVAELIIPIFDMSKPKLPKAGTRSRSHIRTLDSKSPIGRGIGASQPPCLSIPSFWPQPQRTLSSPRLPHPGPDSSGYL